MRKKLLGVAVSALLLTGCSATSPVADSTPTPDPNQAACNNFQSTFIAGVEEAPSVIRGWEKLRDKIDSVALTATGDVKDRMQAFVDDWPDTADIFIFGNLDDVNDKVGAIERACDAIGQNIDGTQLQAVDG